MTDSERAIVFLIVIINRDKKLIFISFFTDLVVRFGSVTLETDFSFEQLSDTSSFLFQSLQETMTTSLKDMFCTPQYPVCSLIITNYRQGSIIVDFLVTISGHRADVVAFLDSQMAMLPLQINGISILAGSFSSGISFELINRILRK